MNYKFKPWRHEHKLLIISRQVSGNYFIICRVKFLLFGVVYLKDPNMAHAHIFEWLPVCYKFDLQIVLRATTCWPKPSFGSLIERKGNRWSSV